MDELRERPEKSGALECGLEVVGGLCTRSIWRQLSADTGIFARTVSASPAEVDKGMCIPASVFGDGVAASAAFAMAGGIA